MPNRRVTYDLQEISLAYAAIKWNGGAIEKRCRVSVCKGYCVLAF